MEKTKVEKLNESADELMLILQTLTGEEVIKKLTYDNLLARIKQIKFNVPSPEDIINEIWNKGQQYSDLDRLSAAEPRYGRALQIGQYTLKIVKTNG